MKAFLQEFRLVPHCSNTLSIPLITFQPRPFISLIKLFAECPHMQSHRNIWTDDVINHHQFGCVDQACNLVGFLCPCAAILKRCNQTHHKFHCKIDLQDLKNTFIPEPNKDSKKIQVHTNIILQQSALKM